jgi:hypothetical protein
MNCYIPNMNKIRGAHPSTYSSMTENIPKPLFRLQFGVQISLNLWINVFMGTILSHVRLRRVFTRHSRRGETPSGDHKRHSCTSHRQCPSLRATLRDLKPPRSNVYVNPYGVADFTQTGCGDVECPTKWFNCNLL